MGTNPSPFSQVADPIKRVVLLIMENHSFDQMLGCMNQVHKDLDGVNAQSPKSNTDVNGTVYLQKPTTELQMRFDPKHEHINVTRQLANANGGFVADFSTTYPTSAPEDRQEIMGYYPLNFLPGLHTLATEFTVCDRWFSSLPGPTWPNRFFALSGTSSGQVLMPDGFWHPNIKGFFAQNQTTLFDRLNERNRPWRVYHYDMACSWILVHQRRIENLLKYHGMDAFFDDAKNGDLPDFTFIEPKYGGRDENDDHPPHNVMKAEKLIADVYNAIRSNDDLWNSTLLVVFYDEHGGFYDHVSPPAAIPPDDNHDQYTFDRYGIRVPAILISPWLNARVDHTQFDHTSLLKYLTDKWQLGSLGDRTGQAQSIATAMPFTASPREDTTPFIRVSNSSLYADYPELEELDDSGHRRALRIFAEHVIRDEDATDGIVTKSKSTLSRRIEAFGYAWRGAVSRTLLQAGYGLANTVRHRDDILQDAVARLRSKRKRRADS